MRAGPLPRLMMCLAAIAIAAAGSLLVASLCVVVIAAGYLAVGQGRVLVRYGSVLLMVVGASAFLWILVRWDFTIAGFSDAVRHALGSDTPFALLARMAVASCLLVLALGSVPDGKHLAMARAQGLPPAAAATYASALALIPLVSLSVERSLVCLRAHGLVSDSRFSAVRNLPYIVSLTWTSCLDLALSRAEVKWTGNGFLEETSNGFRLDLPLSRFDDMVCLVVAVCCAALVVGGRLWLLPI
jgi:hypothetical protein